MEQWQVRQIIKLAKQFNVIDADGTSICAALLKEAVRGINTAGLSRDRRSFYFYMHSVIYNEHVKNLESRQTTHNYSTSYGDVSYAGIYFRQRDWMSSDVILVMEPSNLAIRPLIEQNQRETFAWFGDPSRVWAIINLGKVS